MYFASIIQDELGTWPPAKSSKVKTPQMMGSENAPAAGLALALAPGFLGKGMLWPRNNQKGGCERKRVTLTLEASSVVWVNESTEQASGR